LVVDWELAAIPEELAVHMQFGQGEAVELGLELDPVIAYQ
jgi:hypothetical protein